MLKGIKQIILKFEKERTITKYRKYFKELFNDSKKTKEIKTENDLIVNTRLYFDKKFKTKEEVKNEKKLLAFHLNRRSKSNIVVFLTIFYTVFVTAIIAYYTSALSYMNQLSSYEFQIVTIDFNYLNDGIAHKTSDINKRKQELNRIQNTFKEHNKSLTEMYSISFQNPFIDAMILLFIGIIFHYYIDKYDNWCFQTKTSFYLLCINELEEIESEFIEKEIEEREKKDKLEKWERIEQLMEKKNSISLLGLDNIIKKFFNKNRK